MSNHEQINALLPIYLAGTLDDRQTEAVRAHLAECPLCRADLAFWREVEGTVQAEIEPAHAPQHLLNNALSEISADEKVQNPLTRFWGILRAQVPMFSKEIWPTSLLVLILGFVITLLADRVGVLFAIAPLVSVAGLAFIYNKSYDPAFELVLSTPVSQLQLLMARAGLVFGFNLVVVSLLGLGLSLRFSMAVILPLLQGWLAPMTFLSISGLCLSLFMRPGNAIFITYVLWLSQFLPLMEEFQQMSALFADRLLWFWQTPNLLFLLSFGLVGFVIFWFLKGIRFTRRLA